MKARWHGVPFHDFQNKRWLITLECEEAPQIYDNTKDDDLNVEIKKYRQKRSLNANSYFHVLVDKMADKLQTSHAEVHNLMIARYGVIDEDVKNIILADEIPWQRLESIHLRPTSATKVMDNGKLYRVYIVMKGSHTYDTKQMSVLIDGTVGEAKDLGIETLPPHELERMKSQWNLS